MLDILVLSLEVNMTDAEIKDCVQQMLPICTIKNQGFTLTLAGFDDDPRDIWEIPEAINFMKRLVSLGLISGLEVSSHAEGIVRSEQFGLKELPGFGALEVWLCATQQMKTGRNGLNQELIAKFFKELDSSNRIAEKICKEPSYNKGASNKIKQIVEKIPDSPTRHGCPLPKWIK